MHGRGRPDQRAQGIRRPWSRSRTSACDIKDHEFVVLVGPSGCGKSTTLRMIAGLEDISGGTIAIGGRVVNRLQPKDRDIAMVFQNYALYQHMSVRDNLAFGLRNRQRRRRRDRRRRAPRCQDSCRSSRCSIAARASSRAASSSASRSGAASCATPRCSCSTSRCRTSTRSCARRCALELKELRLRVPTTSVFVTHDQVEAMTLGDRIVVMKDGVMQQVGTSARALSSAGQPVRGELHRLAGDEFP